MTTARLFQIRITRTDRAKLPSGSVVGFSQTVFAQDQTEADQLAAERLARCADAALLFIESVEDVTP